MAVRAIKRPIFEQEKIVGTVGSDFSLTYQPIQGSLNVYLNGVLLEEGTSNDYIYNQISNSIELALSIDNSDILQICYSR